MTSLFSKLTKFGIHQRHTNLERRTILLINLIAALSIFIATIGLTYTIIVFGFVFWGVLSGFICILNYIAVLWFNHKDKFRLSRILIVIYTNMSFLLVTLTLDYQIRPEIIFLTSFPVYVAMFEKLRTIILVSIVTLFVLEGGIYLQILGYVEPIIKAEDYNLTLVYFPQVAITATIILLVTIFFKQTSEQYQLKLESSNSDLADSLKVNKQQKEQLEKSLKENVFLFKEIHHRVKNNMQIVSGLLDLQLKKVEDKVAKEALIQSCKRINAMSLVHQQLYQEDIVDKVPMKKFIADLIENIKRLTEGKEKRIDYQIEIEDIALDIDSAIPLGLVLNELLSNSFKHAFKDADHEDRQIKVSLTKLEDKIIMKVQDNGSGIEDLNQNKSSNSLGLFLVDLLIDQLEGGVKKENNNGLLNTITIPYGA